MTTVHLEAVHRYMVHALLLQNNNFILEYDKNAERRLFVFHHYSYVIRNNIINNYARCVSVLQLKLTN